MNKIERNLELTIVDKLFIIYFLENVRTFLTRTLSIRYHIHDRKSVKLEWNFIVGNITHLSKRLTRGTIGEWERFLECSRKRLAGWHSLERHYPRNFTTRGRWTGNNSAYFFLSLFFSSSTSPLSRRSSSVESRNVDDVDTRKQDVKSLVTYVAAPRKESWISVHEIRCLDQPGLLCICTPMQVINKIHLERQYVWKIDVRSLDSWSEYFIHRDTFDP